MTLRGRITLGTKAFKKGFKKVVVMAKKLGKKLVENFKKASKAMAVGIAAGMALVGTGAILASRKVLQAGDEIHKMGLRTGFTAEELTRLKHAADLSGTSIEGIEDTLKDMQKNLYDASEGSASMAENFKLLGINVDEVMKMSPEEQFRVITNALADLENQNQKSAIAMRIFGEGGRKLLPMLADGSEGLQKMKDDADKLGVTMSQKQVNNIAAFNDSVDRMKKSIFGLFQTAVGFNGMRELVDRMTIGVLRFRESVFFQNAIKNISNFANNMLAMGNGVLRVLNTVGADFFKFAGMVGAAGIAAVVALKAGFAIPLMKGVFLPVMAFLAGFSIGDAILKSIGVERVEYAINKLKMAWLDLKALKLSIARDDDGLRKNDEKHEVLRRRQEELRKSIEEGVGNGKGFMENLSDSVEEKSAIIFNKLGEVFGIDDLQQKVKDSVKAYKEGVEEFKEISDKNAIEDKQTKGGALAQKAEDARKLNKQLKEAGKQVSFVVNLDKFREGRQKQGGIISGSLRNAGEKFRKKFQEVNDNFRKSMKEAGDNAKARFVGAGVDENGQAQGALGINRKVAAGGFAQRGNNIGEKVVNQAGQLNQLVGLAKERNMLLKAIAGMGKVKPKHRGFEV